MNTRELYHYLFSAEETTTPDVINKLKEEDKLRSILRVLDASAIEKKLYGNSIDKLIWTSYFSKQDHAKDFERFNNRYKYLPNNAENIELYRRIYYVCEIILLSQRSSDYYYSFSDYPDLCAYKIMVYFGMDNNAENILSRFDLYCNKNNLSQSKLSDIFPQKLRELNKPIQLPVWQQLIVVGNSPDMITLFHGAPEIERLLSRAPTDINEAMQASQALVRVKEWDHQELVEIFSHATSEKSQLIFVTSINEKNLREFIPDHSRFCSIFPLIKNPTTQAILLAGINTETLQSFATDEYRFAELLKSVDITNVSLLIRKIGIEIILKKVKTCFELSFFMEQRLPRHYDKSVFLLTDLNQKKIKSYIQDQYDIVPLLKMVNYKERLNFLLKTIGKETCALHAKSPFILCQILDELRIDDRFQFIKEVVAPEDLKNMRNDHRYWGELKSKLRKEEDKLAFNQLVYSEEELIAKSTLKNIKRTMQRTKWSCGIFETLTSTRLGKEHVTVPGPALKQVEQFWAVSHGSTSHTEALKEIKKIGQETDKQNKTWTTTAKNLFFAKDETQKYFDNFNSEEAFNKAFVLKK